jgi:hypothetical protein
MQTTRTSFKVTKLGSAVETKYFGKEEKVRQRYLVKAFSIQWILSFV